MLVCFKPCLLAQSCMPKFASLRAGDTSEWERLIQLNLLGPMRLSRFLVPTLSKRPSMGHIINISSILGMQVR